MNVDPILGSLADNGGPTFTHALLPGSPAIDAGDDSVLDPPLSLTTDQRGMPRLRAFHVDIGAFEFEPTNTPPVADNQTVTTTVDTPVGIQPSGSDADTGDTLIFIITSLASRGTLLDIQGTITGGALCGVRRFRAL